MKSLRYQLRFLPTGLKRFLYQRLRGRDTRFLRELYDKHARSIFVHIPKAAGNSVQTALGLSKSGHAPLRLFELALSEAEFRSAFKFAILRDPWTRCASAFHYLKSENCNAHDAAWANAHLSPFADFETFVKEWLSERNVYRYIHFIPQFEFIADNRGNVHLDYLGRVSTLEADLKIIHARMGVRRTLRISHKNRTSSSPGTRFPYSDEVRQIIGRVYRRDVELYGDGCPADLEPATTQTRCTA